MLGRTTCVLGNHLRSSLRQFTQSQNLLLQQTSSRSFTTSTSAPASETEPPVQEASLDPPFTEIDESVSRVRFPGEFSQQDYRYACAQRLSSVDHPSGGTIFLLPWDKGRLLPLQEVLEPYAPEAHLPFPKDRLYDPNLARTAQKLTKDLRVQNLLLEIHEAEEWLPEEARPVGEPSLEELLRERLEDSGVQIHLHKTPDELHTIQPHQAMTSEQMDIAFKDVRA